MSFHEIPRQGAGSALGASMSAALYCTERGTSLRLMLGRDLLNDLGWREHDRATLLFGRDGDLGQARLQATERGGSKLLTPDAKRTGRGCLIFSTQRLPAEIARVPRGALLVDHRIVDGGVEFRVPKGFTASGNRP